jgi:glycolate oxidase FAD binding subunit
VKLLQPATEQEAAGLVAEAAAGRSLLAISTGGSKASLGRPAQSEAALSATGLTGVTLYEPGELVISARAGTPLQDVERILAEKGQELPFEPMGWRALLGHDGAPTVGGMVASNSAGPRRIQAGSCRDGLIGVRLVNGRGEAVKSGGRVMKNVTGLDLVKVMAGSWGTLGFLTEATFKVLPKAEQIATFVLTGLDDVRAVEALTAALGSPFEITGAAHLPGIDAAPARTLLRLQGFASSVTYRLGELKKHLAAFGAAEVLPRSEADTLWRDIRDAVPLAEPRTDAVWRISVAPTRGPIVVDAIRRALQARHFYDWGGGLVWIAVPATGDAGARAVRTAVAAARGHAMLVRAPTEVRAVVDVFEPLPPPLMRLIRGIKEAFDPAGIFEPGRMYAGV